MQVVALLLLCWTLVEADIVRVINYAEENCGGNTAQGTIDTMGQCAEVSIGSKYSSSQLQNSNKETFVDLFQTLITISLLNVMPQERVAVVSCA